MKTNHHATTVLKGTGHAVYAVTLAQLSHSSRANKHLLGRILDTEGPHVSQFALHQPRNSG